MHQLHHHFVLDHLRIVRQILREVHRARRHPLAVEDLHPLRSRLRLHRLFNRQHRLACLRHPLRVRRIKVRGVRAQEVCPNRPAHLRPQRSRKRPNRQRAVFRRVGPVHRVGRRRQLPGVVRVDQFPVRRTTVTQRVHLFHPRHVHRVCRRYPHHPLHLERQCRLQQCALNRLPFAGPLAVEQRRADAPRHRQPRGVIRHGGRLDRLRLTLLGYLPLARHQPGRRLRHNVVAGTVLPRAIPPECRVVHVDQLRLQRAQRLVIDLQSRCHVRTVVDHHHVHLRHQPVHNPLRLWLIEFQHQRLLAAVQFVKPLRLARDELLLHPPRLAAQRLHLNHFRAHIRQMRTGERPRQDLREFQHLDPIQRP